MNSQNPEQWDFCPIGNYIEVLTDYTANGSFASLKENVQYFNEKNYAALVRTTDLEKDKFCPQRFTDKKGYEFLKKSSLTPGDIVIANVGSAGKAYRVPDANMPMTLAPNMYLVKFCKSMDSDFLFQVITNERFYSDLMSNVGSSTLNAINKSNFRSINIFVPPLPEQKKIASILTSVDEVIEKTQSQINKLQDLKKGTMNELLTKGIGHTEFKDSELGRIPKSWEVVSLFNLCSLHYGKSPKEIMDEDGKYPIYGTGGIVGKTNSSLHSGKSIVIGRKGSIDNVSFVESPFWAIDTTYYVEEKNVEMKWLFYRLHYEGLSKYNEASGVPSLNRDTLYNVSIQLPSKSEQTKICAILDTVDSQIGLLNDKLSQTQSLKKSLMQDLLTGKVRVTVN